MEIQIKTSGLPAAKKLRAHANDRIRATLGRFGHIVQLVSVRLSDINGPRGGADKLCRIVIQMKTRSLVLEELGVDMRRVIDRLADRVQHNVCRQLEQLARLDLQLSGARLPIPITRQSPPRTRNSG